MKASLYTVILLFCLTSCKKDITIEDNIILTGQPLDVLKAYTKGDYRLKYIRYGFTQYRDTIDNVYLNITKDSIILSVNGNYSRSNLTWKQITTAQQKKTYAMNYGAVIDLPPGLYPGQVENGLLILAEDGADGNIYYLERK